MLRGTPHADVIVGLGGDDQIGAAGGDDVVCGGRGDDAIWGGPGNDRLFGGPGNDALYGRRGNDRLRGGTGSDRLWGGPGADALFGWRGDDRLHGGPGRDLIDGGPGLDLCVSPAAAQGRHCENTIRVSVDSAGREVRLGGVNDLAISDSGRYTAFASFGRYVAGDDNGTSDVFVHDARTGRTERASVSTTGQGADDFSGEPSLSAGGRYVAFESSADNLVPSDTNGFNDVFVHDRRTGATTLASVASDGSQAQGSPGDTGSALPDLSATGRYVVFASNATGLVPGDTNATWDVFVHDNATGATTRMSVASDGSQANDASADPTISNDGRYVAFTSGADNLVEGDTNGALADVFVHDRLTGRTTRVSVGPGGEQENGASFGARISGNGRYVAFSSLATNLVAGRTGRCSLLVFDRRRARSTCASVRSDGTSMEDADRSERPATISNGGRFVAFIAINGRPVSDVYVHDAATSNTRRVSLTYGDTASNGYSSDPVLSGDGRLLAFVSRGTNLVPDDLNRTDDAFLRILR